MGFRTPWTALLTLLALGTSYAVAQNCDCDTLQPPGLNTECGVDPNDGSQLGVEFAICECSPNVVQLTATWTGTDQIATTGTASSTISSNANYQTITLPFNEVNTNIQSGSQVTLAFAVTNGQYGVVSYTYSPVTSIYYAQATVTSTATVNSVTTTTVSSTTTTTTTIPQQTSISACTTGTNTVSQPDVTTTLTTTITPAPVTITVATVVTSSTSLTCVATKNIKGVTWNRRHAGAHALNRRQSNVNAGAVETDWCLAISGAPNPTTYTSGTSTVVVSYTATSTVTTTSTETDTVTSTSTPATTTLCNNVQATVTLPVTTDTVTTTVTLPTSTTTTTNTLTVITTVYKSGRPTACGKLPAPPRGTPRPGWPRTLLKPTKSSGKKTTSH